LGGGSDAGTTRLTEIDVEGWKFRRKAFSTSTELGIDVLKYNYWGRNLSKAARS